MAEESLPGAGPRLVQADIDSCIVGALYYVFHAKHTVCCLKLVNGFTVTGESACVDPKNFNAKLGEELALADAKRKIWQLEGYLLQQRLWLRQFGMTLEPQGAVTDQSVKSQN